MDRNQYADADYRQPHVPPATPPVIDSNASADDAATLAGDNGDSDAPGSQPAHFNRGREDESVFDHGREGHLRSGGGHEVEPGEQPDEVVPDKGDDVVPDRAPDEVVPDKGDFDEPDRTPDEVVPDKGDFDEPDRSPIENPPQPDTAPAETPMPPD